MYTYSIIETSEKQRNTIEQIYMYLYNIIQCCIDIHITDTTDKPEQESMKKNKKLNPPESSETCDDAS